MGRGQGQQDTTSSAARVLTEIDANEAPDLDQVAGAWKATLDKGDNLEETTTKAFRDSTGAAAPSSIVRSAEGHVLFSGINDDTLSDAARASLKEEFRLPSERQDDAEEA